MYHFKSLLFILSSNISLILSNNFFKLKLVSLLDTLYLLLFESVKILFTISKSILEESSNFSIYSNCTSFKLVALRK